MVNTGFVWFTMAIPISLIAGILTFYTVSTVLDASKAQTDASAVEINRVLTKVKENNYGEKEIPQTIEETQDSDHTDELDNIDEFDKNP